MSESVQCFPMIPVNLSVPIISLLSLLFPQYFPITSLLFPYYCIHSHSFACCFSYVVSLFRVDFFARALVEFGAWLVGRPFLLMRFFATPKSRGFHHVFHS